ncbi:tyrosine-type recombinase/integrase [Lactococcus protaetiae]|uniref:Site-specific integrase n=1 Tax=Lactococcus protaetiae TaxID=2592653 RepID=A0A514ZA82_9LACT|nr:site-specific integrase [Lactococcus protaetiae]QDK71494.1 site-specific integrase [Lactococcus protaetiae]
MWIENLPNGKYKYIERYNDPYTDKSKKASITLNKNTPQAKKQALALLQEKIDKLTNQDEITSKITLVELYDEWFSRYQKTVKQRSAIATRKVIKKVFKNIPPDMLVRKADRQLFLKFLDEIYTFGNLSYSYTTQIKNTLGNMFSYAVERKYLSKNPITPIKIKRKKDEEENYKQKMDEKYLEKEEIYQIISYLQERNQTRLHARIIEFLWLTGLRYGELQALQWKDYDGKSIDVNGTLGVYNKAENKTKKISPKTIASNRIVDLPQRAIDILEETRVLNKISFNKISSTDYLFLSNRGMPLSISAFNRVLKNIEKDCHIDKTLSSHIFRHSHVSLLAELNLPLKSIMERVGHSNANTTLKIYNHVTKKTRDEVMEALNNIK